MPCPKSKKSRSARNMRRSHHALKTTQLSTCNNCQEMTLPHRVCASCGYLYANKKREGQTVVETES